MSDISIDRRNVTTPPATWVSEREWWEATVRFSGSASATKVSVDRYDYDLDKEEGVAAINAILRRIDELQNTFLQLARAKLAELRCDVEEIHRVEGEALSWNDLLRRIEKVIINRERNEYAQIFYGKFFGGWGGYPYVRITLTNGEITDTDCNVASFR